MRRGFAISEILIAVSVAFSTFLGYQTQLVQKVSDFVSKPTLPLFSTSSKDVQPSAESSQPKQGNLNPSPFSPIIKNQKPNSSRDSGINLPPGWQIPGDYCGGSAGATCRQPGYSCLLEGSYPEASGRCVKVDPSALNFYKQIVDEAKKHKKGESFNIKISQVIYKAAFVNGLRFYIKASNNTMMGEPINAEFVGENDIKGTFSYGPEFERQPVEFYYYHVIDKDYGRLGIKVTSVTIGGRTGSDAEKGTVEQEANQLAFYIWGAYYQYVEPQSIANDKNFVYLGFKSKVDAAVVPPKPCAKEAVCSSGYYSCADSSGCKTKCCKDTSTPPPPPPSQGQFCGGMVGAKCPAGYRCQLDGNYPDAGGVCIK